MKGDLPAALSQAAERLLEGVSRKDLAERVAGLSEIYRAGGSSTTVASEPDVIAYVFSRLPATYAAVAAVLAEVKERCPGFAPASMLDAGAGPGTASWAAIETWPALESVTMADTNRNFLALGERLAAGSPHVALRESDHLVMDFTGLSKDRRADLVVASYALAEVESTKAERVAERLWESSSGLLVVIEPGTPAGFARIRDIRSALIAKGGAVVAPCPHDGPCPIVAPDWCHFAQRLPRSRDHRLAKSASLSFEDEKFSYVAVARPEVTIARPEARVLARPRMSKAEIRLKLCMPRGLVERTVPRRERDTYAGVRNVRWGDAIDRDDALRAPPPSRNQLR